MFDAASAASPVRILFAEDSQHLREYMSKQLQSRGYAVTDVPSGDEALAALLGGIDADLLLTDIHMPGGLDGWALARRCRALRPGLAVIYTSSERTVPEEQVPNSHFMPKPYGLAALLATIEQVATDRRNTSMSVATDVAQAACQVPLDPSSV